MREAIDIWWSVVAGILSWVPVVLIPVWFYRVGMSTRWSNVPARWWLWRHQRHAWCDLSGRVWFCACGSVYPRRRVG